jgi:hypothetical protein
MVLEFVGFIEFIEFVGFVGFVGLGSPQRRREKLIERSGVK